MYTDNNSKRLVSVTYYAKEIEWPPRICNALFVDINSNINHKPLPTPPPHQHQHQQEQQTVRIKYYIPHV